MKPWHPMLLAWAMMSVVSVMAVECPLDMVDDGFPGACIRYVDKDGNRICDMSQASTTTMEETTKTQASAAAPAQPATTSTLPAMFGLFQGSGGGYDFINLTVAMILVYGASFALYRTDRITVRTHRRVWNVLLLFTFLVSAVLGILLILKINYGIVIPLPFNMLYWHVEAGIAMTLISVFHILWHLEYFKAAFGLPSKPETAEPRGKRGR